jgi:hypothetical protein
MRSLLLSIVLTVLAAGSLQMLYAQDLAPRAYVITPIHTNVVNATYSYSTGGINFSNTLPITGIQGTIHIPNINIVSVWSAPCRRRFLWQAFSPCGCV